MTGSAVKSLVLRPAPYGIWAILVAATLFASSFGNPYVFGFVTLGLGWLTGAVAVVALAVCLFSKKASPRDRAIILVAVVVAAASVAIAVKVLGTYNWA